MPSPKFMTRPARQAMSLAACGNPGAIRPMKSLSIWKSMSLACTLYLGVPESVAGTPRPQVGVPEAVARLPEHGAEVLGGGIQALVVEHLGEGHVDVEIILLERVGDALGGPRRQRRIVD